MSTSWLMKLKGICCRPECKFKLIKPNSSKQKLFLKDLPVTSKVELGHREERQRGHGMCLKFAWRLRISTSWTWTWTVEAADHTFCISAIPEHRVDSPSRSQTLASLLSLIVTGVTGRVPPGRGLRMHKWKQSLYRASLSPSRFGNIFQHVTLLAAKQQGWGSVA